MERVYVFEWKDGLSESDEITLYRLDDTETVALIRLIEHKIQYLTARELKYLTWPEYSEEFLLEDHEGNIYF
jgi:hypothetical protein